LSEATSLLFRMLRSRNRLRFCLTLSTIAREIETLAGRTLGVQKVGNLRLRRSGPYVVGYVEIFVEGKMPLIKVHKVRSSVQESIREKITGINNITVVALPAELEGTS